MTIFVSIAAYRDPELVATIEDCLAKARWPAQLRFGVCWQHGEGEARPPELPKGRMRLLDVPYQDSQGACWARAEIMKLYDGEDYFLQIDSHHRFVPHWDERLLRQLELTGAERPIVSSYGSPFDPGRPDVAWRRGIVLHAFMPDAVPTFYGNTLPESAPYDRPLRARFVAAGSLFTLGRFVEDVPYDPALYFLGEEITLAIRAFTWGYDLFHPSEHIIWHEIEGSQRSRHWDDHLPGQTGVSWFDRDTASRARAAAFLRRPHVGPFGCGTRRSFADYEAYAGVIFRRRYASAAARQGVEPPLPPPSDPGRDLRDWSVRLVLDPAALPAGALDRPQFWYLGFHDETATEVAREDVQTHELARALAQSAGPIVIERRFRSARAPKSWLIWPTDKRGRWLDQLSGPVDETSLA